MGATGLEQSRDAQRKTIDPESLGSNSGNNPALKVPAAPTDPDLARLVAAWPNLPQALRAGIVAIVRAAGCV